METGITITVAVVGCVVAVLTYFAGTKKVSNGDVEKRAYFQGEITAKLDQLISTVDKLDKKLTLSTNELHAEIDRKIAEHEKRYHNGRD